MSVDGKRGRGRLKKRWFEVIDCDMRMTGVCEEDAKDRSKWKLRTRAPNSWERRRRKRRRSYAYMFMKFNIVI